MEQIIENKAGLRLQSEGDNIIIMTKIMGFEMPLSTLTPTDIKKAIAFMQDHLINNTK